MKKLILFTMMTFCMSATAWAQKTVVSNETEQEENAFDVVEDMPEYPGGMSALMQFLGQNIKYPEDAIKQNKQGRVVASFVVEKDGSISNAVVNRCVWPSLDAEALRVIRAMPKWKPGKQGGKVVRVKFTIPINFSIPADEKKEK